MAPRWSGQRSRQAQGCSKNLEGKGNPWGMGAGARLDWARTALPRQGARRNRVGDRRRVAHPGRLRRRLRDRAKKDDARWPGCSYAGVVQGCSATARPPVTLARRAAAAVPDVGGARRRDVRVRCHQGRRDLCALLQHDQNEYPQIGGNYEVVPGYPPRCATSSCRWRGRRTCRGCRRRATLPLLGTVTYTTVLPRPSTTTYAA